MNILEWVLESTLKLSNPVFKPVEKYHDNNYMYYIAGGICFLIVFGIIFLMIWGLIKLIQ